MHTPNTDNTIFSAKDMGPAKTNYRIINASA